MSLREECGGRNINYFFKEISEETKKDTWFIRMSLKIYEGEAPRTGLYISALDSKEMGDFFFG